MKYLSYSLWFWVLSIALLALPSFVFEQLGSGNSDLEAIQYRTIEHAGAFLFIAIMTAMLFWLLRRRIEVFILYLAFLAVYVFSASYGLTNWIGLPVWLLLMAMCWQADAVRRAPPPTG